MRGGAARGRRSPDTPPGTATHQNHQEQPHHGGHYPEVLRQQWSPTSRNPSEDDYGV